MPVEKIKKESVGDRFNGAVVKEMEKKFDATHDVTGDYFTHAFPFDNLASIVNVGGLVTPNELRRRKVGFKRGSDASFGSTIFFSKNEIQGYSISQMGDKKDKVISAAILVPTQEFHRVSRTRNDLVGSHVFKEGDYRDPNARSVSNEFPLYTEHAYMVSDRAVRAAEEISQKLLKQKIDRSKNLLDKIIAQAEADFKDGVESLSAISVNERDSVMKELGRGYHFDENPFVYSVERGIKELENLIQTKEKAFKDLEIDCGFQKETIRFFLDQKKPSFLQNVVENLGFKTRRQSDVVGLEKQAKEQDGILVSAQEEIAKLREQLLESKQRYEQLKVAYKLLMEKRRAIGVAQRAYDNSVNEFKKYYRTEPEYDMFGINALGEGFLKVLSQMRKAYGVPELERVAKVNIDHSIILVEIEGAEDAVKATENKPGLRSRIILFDGKKLSKEIEDRVSKDDHSLGDSVDVLNILTKTEDGFAILKAAQSGSVGGQKLNGLISLADYLVDQKKFN